MFPAVAGAPPVPRFPGLIEQAAALRERSHKSGLRRGFTVAESIVTALVSRGVTYRAAAGVYGATVKTVAFHADQAARKVVDGDAADVELETLPPKLRLLVWARRASAPSG